MSNLAVRVVPEPLRSLAYTSFGGSSYVGVGSPLQNPCHSYKWNNNTDVDLFLSWDGIYDHEFMPAKSGFVYDIASNKSEPAGTLHIAQFTRFYVREVSAAATTGSVYITIYYGFNG